MGRGEGNERDWDIDLVEDVFRDSKKGVFGRIILVVGIFSSNSKNDFCFIGFPESALREERN